MNQERREEGKLSRQLTVSTIYSNSDMSQEEGNNYLASTLFFKNHTRCLSCIKSFHTLNNLQGRHYDVHFTDGNTDFLKV